MTEELHDDDFIQQRCDVEAFSRWMDFIRDPRHSPEALQEASGVPAAQLRGAARLYAQAGNGAIYYGLGVTEHSQGSTAVMGIANLAMLTGNLGREGVGVNPMRGQNNVQGSCDMGSFPHELPGYRHLSDDATRALFEREWQVTLDPEPGMRIPNMFDAAVDGDFRGPVSARVRMWPSPTPIPSTYRRHWNRWSAWWCRTSFSTRRPSMPTCFCRALPSWRKNGTFTNAERRISPVRKVMPPLSGKEDWEVTVDLANAMGCAMDYRHPAEIMDEIARLTPTFDGVSYARLDALGSIQWPCNDAAPEGTPTMHVDEFVRGKGFFALTGICTHGRARQSPLSAAADHRAYSQPVQRGRPDPAHRQQLMAPGRYAGDPSA